jgi:hypothetical protein
MQDFRKEIETSPYNDKPGYKNNKPNRGCPTVVKDELDNNVPLEYELAELKSSLLIQNILNNQRANKELTDFVMGIMKVIYDSSLPNFIQKYSVNLVNSQQKDLMDGYPVAQMKKFINNPGAISSDFLALYSFLKYTWYLIFMDKFNFLTENCTPQILHAVAIVSLIQQNMQWSVESAKGPRLNYPMNDNSLRSDQVGISNIKVSELIRQTPNAQPGNENEPWFHPGRVQCRVPYMGKYGENLEKYRKNNSMYASMQCGISGSVNFGLFMYLASLVGSNSQSQNPFSDAKKLIITTTTVLVSDGGHNIRETITGLTLMSITLKIWLTDIQNEINNQYGRQINLITDANKLNNIPTGPVCKAIYNLAEKFQETLPDVCKNNAMYFFNLMLYSFGLWSTFIDAMYEITKTVNPLAIYNSDLNAFDSNILKNKTQSYEYAKNIMYQVWLGNLDKYSEQAKIAMMILTGLDADRYMLDPDESFKKKASTLFEQAVEKLEGGQDILQKTQQQLDQIISECNNKAQTFGTEAYANILKTADKIPLAFSSSRKVNKSKFANKDIISLDVCQDCNDQDFSVNEDQDLKCNNCGAVGKSKPMSDNDMETLAREMVASGFILKQ